ncbi:beta-glucosidase [Elasticomyces elasticus]|uniref:beta-glucosidase n=1 Tax=Exophiala sideris TaxID=1016849 RepID=A0ABR0J1D3_9EURO|nr:beta-glucosidase [Elasticomyces elasticus]KAK5023808.1 beta-glucosidase [Exophiala sideris]KAK5030173.1 beta-glucosidase [Exophiala sideris]KAK5053668.1 beta-glucosidase [Exophiala sideris]KAK5179289.1 beta-glucosidase [Eurotiomycetes sp. CCFEE 6388]
MGTELVRRGGVLPGEEAIAKGASIILGPTANMQRSPLGGRGFESFSEDPVLAGLVAAAAINGIQSKGVAATLKHFVGNDQEHQRQSVDDIVTERALREIYLMPFQIAQKHSSPWSYMTAYNSVNGIHVSEDPKLLRSILRDEWGFDGMIMSDWFGTYSATESIKAGLDLEMPGPSYCRGQMVKQALGFGKLSEYDIDGCVREVLKLVKKVMPLELPENGDESSIDSPETAALLRLIASSSIVLMKNERGTLPFKKDKTTAVIGPNAAIAAYSGGGSASLLPYYAVSPLEGIKSQVPTAQYTIGAPEWRDLPLISNITTTEGGKPGLCMRLFLDPPSKKNRQVVDELYVSTSNLILYDYQNPKIPSNLYWAELEGSITPEESSDYDFSISVAGTAKLYVDGVCVVDNETKQTSGDSFFGKGTVEEVRTTYMEKGKRYNILVTFGTLPTQTCTAPGAVGFGAGGVRIGGARKLDRETEISRAVELALQVDQVIVCAGLNKDWESEGYDRPNMDLPEGSDELIRAIVSANPNTAVVIQSGTPVSMPWLHEVPALIQAWYGGNETGNAIADVVFGDVTPSGKLPLTFPILNEDNPAFLNFRSERGRTLYGEDVYVGYRFYEKSRRAVNFPFGHGLSYTSFVMENLSVKDAISPSEEIVVTVDVLNTGSVAGAQVVQVYVAQDSPTINRPPKELKGFTKVHLNPGSRESVEVRMFKNYAASFWDEDRNAWVMEQGRYSVLVRDSSTNTPLTGSFEVETTRWWTGL